MQFQIGAASACFTAVTAFGLASGIRLLRPGTAAWYGVIVAAAVMVLVLLFSGWALLVPVLLGAAAVAAGGRTQLRRTENEVRSGAGGQPAVTAREPSAGRPVR
jgi:amino acid efflux transporter